MLTKTDLQKIKQSIKEVALTKDDAKSFVRRDDLRSFVTKDDLKPIKLDIAKIRKDTGTITDFFDKEYLDFRQRVERIEKHLNLSPLQ
ncbi:hypothetical protein M1271_00955 [Patescibacteria group bacterium]|nr:hypothetical protein [Patescibacteria group bacterium]